MFLHINISIFSISPLPFSAHSSLSYKLNLKVPSPNGSVREYEAGVTGLQIAESISPALARDVVSCGVNGETTELNMPINSDATIALYKFDDPEGKKTFLQCFCQQVSR